jgi:SAM-dependent methyltransferase
MLFSAGPDLPRVRADSARLPFRDKSFDRVVCNLGLLHFPDPDAAVREAARAVKPGGVVAFSVWAPDAEALTVVPKSLQALGLAPSTANAPGFFRFGEPGEFEATIRGAGLVPLPTARFAWNGPVEGPESLWRMFRTGSARTRAAILSLPETDQQRLRDEVVRRAETFRVGGRTLVPTAVVIGRGRRP